jgi:hypothetical protein
MHTTNIYSYYGNQEGFCQNIYSVVYNTKKQKNIGLNLIEPFAVVPGNYECCYDHNMYSLAVGLCAEYA